MWSRECDEIKQTEMSHDLEKRRIEALALNCEENKHILLSARSSLAISETDEQEVNNQAHQPKLNHTMLRFQQGSDARLAKLHPQVTKSVLSSYLDDQSLSRLSTSCVTLYAQTDKIREKRAFLQYLQAIVFNSQSEISSILNS